MLANTARATDWVGDLVYCDLGVKGVFEPGLDVPLDDVEVECEKDGTVCLSTTATTGIVHPSLEPDVLAFNRFCGDLVDYEIEATGLPAGRWLVNVLQTNPATGQPFCPFVGQTTCTARVVNPPADCDMLVTPIPGLRPVDGNLDGDFCDILDDGPFPEDEILGDNGVDQAVCEDLPSRPDVGIHELRFIQPVSNLNKCSLYAGTSA